MEPDEAKPGQRVFSVRVQGGPAISDFDIMQEAGGPNRSLVKELRGIEVQDKLVLDFAPAANAALPASVLSGNEILAEGW
jgi:hypothetical protein